MTLFQLRRAECTACRKAGRETSMATVMHQEELVRRALKYISDRKQTCPTASFDSLLDEASMRFNLSPRDQESLQRLFAEQTGGVRS